MLRGHTPKLNFNDVFLHRVVPRNGSVCNAPLGTGGQHNLVFQQRIFLHDADDIPPRDDVSNLHARCVFPQLILIQRLNVHPSWYETIATCLRNASQGTLDPVEDLTKQTRSQFHTQRLKGPLHRISHRQSGGFFVDLRQSSPIDRARVSCRSLLQDCTARVLLFTTLRFFNLTCSVASSPSNRMISPMSCSGPTRTSSYIADPPIPSATTTGPDTFFTRLQCTQITSVFVCDRPNRGFTRPPVSFAAFFFRSDAFERRHRVPQARASRSCARVRTSHVSSLCFVPVASCSGGIPSSSSIVSFVPSLVGRVVCRPCFHHGLDRIPSTWAGSFHVHVHVFPSDRSACVSTWSFCVVHLHVDATSLDSWDPRSSRSHHRLACFVDLLLRSFARFHVHHAPLLSFAMACTRHAAHHRPRLVVCRVVKKTRMTQMLGDAVWRKKTTRLAMDSPTITTRTRAKGVGSKCRPHEQAMQTPYDEGRGNKQPKVTKATEKDANEDAFQRMERTRRNQQWNVPSTTLCYTVFATKADERPLVVDGKLTMRSSILPL